MNRFFYGLSSSYVQMWELDHKEGRAPKLWYFRTVVLEKSLGLQIGKGVCQGCILSPCLLNLHAEYIMRNAGLDEAQAGIKIVGEISITSDMQMKLPLCQKAKN